MAPDRAGPLSGHKPGDAVIYRQDYYRDSRDMYARWFIYVLGDDGRWYRKFAMDTSRGAHMLADRLVPEARAALAADHSSIEITPSSETPPDINDVISTTVPDSDVERQMVYDDTLA